MYLSGRDIIFITYLQSNSTHYRDILYRYGPFGGLVEDLFYFEKGAC